MKKIIALFVALLVMATAVSAGALPNYLVDGSTGGEVKKENPTEPTRPVIDKRDPEIQPKAVATRKRSSLPYYLKRFGRYLVGDYMFFTKYNTFMDYLYEVFATKTYVDDTARELADWTEWRYYDKAEIDEMMANCGCTS